MPSKRLNVVFVAKYFPPMRRTSGTMRYSYALCKALAKSVNLTVVTFDGKGAFEDDSALLVKRVQAPFPLHAGLACKALNPDVVLFESGITTASSLLPYVSVFKAVVGSTPLVLLQATRMRHSGKVLVPFISRLASKVIVLNSTTLTFFKDAKANAVLVPPGVNVRELRKVRPVVKSRVRFGYFGDFLHNKGPDACLSAFVRAKPRNAELVLAGEGSLMGELKRESSKHHNVKVFGFLENIDSFIKSCDAVVLPFKDDYSVLGVSLTALEAMSFGIPVIGSNFPTLTDAITHNKDGLIVRNERALEKAIAFLARSPAVRKRLGVQARKKVEKEYTIALAAERVLNVLREVV